MYLHTTCRWNTKVLDCALIRINDYNMLNCRGIRIQEYLSLNWCHANTRCHLGYSKQTVSLYLNFLSTEQCYTVKRYVIIDNIKSDCNFKLIYTVCNSIHTDSALILFEFYRKCVDSAHIVYAKNSLVNYGKIRKQILVELTWSTTVSHYELTFFANMCESLRP